MRSTNDYVVEVMGAMVTAIDKVLSILEQRNVWCVCFTQSFFCFWILIVFIVEQVFIISSGKQCMSPVNHHIQYRNTEERQ